MDRQSMLDALGAAGFDVSLITDATPDALLAEILAGLAPPAPVPDAPVQAMADLSRDEMTAALVGAGKSADELAALDDAALKALYDQEFPAGEAPVEAMADLTRDEMVAALLEKGKTQEELDALDDAGVKALYDAEFPAQFADDAPVEEEKKEEEAAKMSERRRRQVAAKRQSGWVKFSDIASIVRPIVDAAVRQVSSQLDVTRRQTKQLLANTKRANIVAFCETLRNEGRLLPAQFNSVVERLMRANATQVVRRFSEKGKTRALTELDLQQDELRRGPVLISFAERLKQPAGASHADNDEAFIDQHFAAFSEKYTKAGTTKDKLVKAFKTLKARDKNLTAREFLGVK